jgi:hypothetical protein
MISCNYMITHLSDTLSNYVSQGHQNTLGITGPSPSDEFNHQETAAIISLTRARVPAYVRDTVAPDAPRLRREAWRGVALRGGGVMWDKCFFFGVFVLRF